VSKIFSIENVLVDKKERKTLTMDKILSTERLDREKYERI